MSHVITTAGARRPSARGETPVDSVRREALRRVRQVMRDPEATDAVVEDALAALVELSKV